MFVLHDTKSRILLFLFLISCANLVESQSCNGTWSKWKIDPPAACNDTCGACGRIRTTRVCEPSNCTCTGNDTEVQGCNNVVCAYPRPSCCNGFTKTLDRVARSYYCSQSPSCTGEWSKWATDPTGACNDTCGMCGTERKKRYCFPSGCKCEGSDTETQPCGTPVCLYPRSSCCSGFVKTLNRTARKYECVSNATTTTSTATAATGTTTRATGTTTAVTGTTTAVTGTTIKATTTTTTATTTTALPPDCTVIGPKWTYWAEDRMCYGTIGSGGNYYTMEQYKAGACNTFHSGAEPASFTSQEQWDYLVGADNKIVVDQPLWIGLEFDAAGNLAWINGQPVTWVRAPAALGNTGTPGFAFDDLWEPNDPAVLLDLTIICRAAPPPS